MTWLSLLESGKDGMVELIVFCFKILIFCSWWEGVLSSFFLINMGPKLVDSGVLRIPGLR